MQLILPTKQYQESFLEAWQEFLEEPTESYRFAAVDDTIEDVRANFDAFLEREKSRMAGKDLPPGSVPQTHFWLIDHDRVIGEVSLRHTLNDKLKKHGGHIGYGVRPSERNKGYGKKMLALALKEAKKLGIEKALVTCDVTNIGSRKIIKANGGVLQDVVPNPGKPDKMRWWLNTHI